VATPRILELSPKGLGPAHWVLWLLRTRKDPPSLKGGGVATAGRDRTGANTDGKHAEAASWRQLLGYAAPHQPCHLQVHLSPWSLLMWAEGVGLRTNSGRRAAGRPVCESGDRSRWGSASPGPGSFRWLSAFLSNCLLPSVSEAGRQGLPPAEVMGF